MDFYKEAVSILCYGTELKQKDVRLVLEDAESPITRKTIETLYNSVIEKKHIDFGDIPKSKGVITNYSGYKSMMETLDAIKALARENQTYKDLFQYAEIVSIAIGNLTSNATQYAAAFSSKNEILMIEYNTFVFTCVEATTSILYQFSDFMKTPSSHQLNVNLQNTKYRADLFYVDQLREFNKINASGKYRKYLAAVLRNGKEAFLGIDDGLFVGAVTIIAAVMLSIVPVTRKIIYTIQDFRGRLAAESELQAYFLELNANYLKTRSEKSPEKTAKILKKQEKVRLQFLRLAEKLRVKSVKAEQLGRRTLEEENKTLTMDSMREKIDDSDFDIF